MRYQLLVPKSQSKNMIGREWKEWMLKLSIFENGLHATSAYKAVQKISVTMSSAVSTISKKTNKNLENTWSTFTLRWGLKIW